MKICRETGLRMAPHNPSATLKVTMAVEKKVMSFV